MRIELICSGTELLLDKLNSNSILIGQCLSKLGLNLAQVITVGDDARDMQNALKDSLRRSKVVLCSGGLGPTFDDLTRECVSKVTHKPLIYSQAIFKQIQGRFKAARRLMPQENERQTYIIRGAKPILNLNGTAPGQIISLKSKTLILLPGPPRELLPMLKSHVLPYLKKTVPTQYSQRLMLHVFGHPESHIDELIQPVISRNWDFLGSSVTFGILAHRAIVDVKATLQDSNLPRLKKSLKIIRTALYKKIGPFVYGEEDETLESIVGRELKKKHQTLSLAESCTGGLIASKITNIAGSSDYFAQGLTTYSNQSKINLLGVKKKTLQKFGAVSEQTALEMAKGCLKRGTTDWAVSVTGIAGPGGGTKQKPIGTVCFGIASKKKAQTYTQHLYGSRSDIRERAALTALEILRRELLNIL